MSISIVFQTPDIIRQMQYNNQRPAIKQKKIKKKHKKERQKPTDKTK